MSVERKTSREIKDSGNGLIKTKELSVSISDKGYISFQIFFEGFEGIPIETRPNGEQVFLPTDIKENYFYALGATYNSSGVIMGLKWNIGHVLNGQFIKKSSGEFDSSNDYKLHEMIDALSSYTVRIGAEQKVTVDGPLLTLSDREKPVAQILGRLTPKRIKRWKDIMKSPSIQVEVLQEALCVRFPI